MTGQQYSKELGKTAVSLIHQQLEAFKYFGCFVPVKNKEGDVVESGEGLPLPIVALPDFVLDFHGDRLRGQDAPVCSVGGNAGGVSSVLMRLMSDEDATHRVHFLTRTTRIAKMLLHDECQAPASKPAQEGSGDTFRRYCEPFIFERSGQPRWAYLNDTNIDPNEAKSDQELKAKRHIEGQSFVLDALNKARVVYVGSFKTPDYSRILKSVWKSMGKEGVLVLDTRHSRQKHSDPAPQLRQSLKELQQLTIGESREVLLLVASSDLDWVIAQAKKAIRLDDPQQIAKNLGIRILCYGRASIHLYTAHTHEVSGAILSDLGSDIESTEPSVRFRAGMILGVCVYHALQTLPQVLAKQTKNCTKDWGAALVESFNNRWRDIGGSWSGASAYGVALASLDLNNRQLSPKLVFGDSQGAGAGGHTDACVEETVNGIRRLRLSSADVTGLSAMAARRRNSALSNAKLARCSPMSPTCKKCLIDKRKASVMIDLDGTLLDSTFQRGRALEKALRTFHDSESLRGKLTFRDAASPLGSFEKFVYDRHAFFQWLGLGDFRQQWNHPGWYAAYVVLGQDEHLNDAVGQAALDWEKTRVIKELDQRQRALRVLKDSKQLKEFVENYHHALRRYGVEIGRAIRSFSEVQLHPFKEARDFLTSLKSTNAFNLYIVSEGDPDTQWNKLVSIGLSEFFDRSHVLTTGDVAPEYDGERKQFEQENRILERKLETIQRERNYARNVPAILDGVQEQIVLWHGTQRKDELRKMAVDVTAPVRGKNLEEQQLLDEREREVEQERIAARCVEKILASLREKLSLSFYAAVIRAIMRNPSRPLDTLRNLKEIRRAEADAPRMKFVMIGDRQSKDLHPPLELLSERREPRRRGIATIRLLSGSYAKDENPDDADGEYNPDYLALTLAHVKALLLSAKTWQETPCLVNKPPLFNWDVNLAKTEHEPADPASSSESIGLDHLFTGMSMMPTEDYPIISGICAAFLSEYVGRCSQKDREAILTRLLDEHVVPEKRAARISGFVLAGALTHPNMSKGEKLQFAEGLANCSLDKMVSENASIKLKVVNALHWVAKHCTGEARKKAEEAIARL